MAKKIEHVCARSQLLRYCLSFKRQTDSHGARVTFLMMDEDDVQSSGFFQPLGLVNIPRRLHWISVLLM